MNIMVWAPDRKSAGCFFCGMPSGHMGDCPVGLPSRHRDKQIWWNGWLLGFMGADMPTKPTKGVLTGWMLDPDPGQRDGRILCMGWVQGSTVDPPMHWNYR